MPFIFRCGECGITLHEDLDPKLNERYMESVTAKLGDKCPYCGHKLQIPPLNVKVYPVEGDRCVSTVRVVSESKKLINRK